MRFQITEGVRRLGVHGAFAVLTGLDNTCYPAALEAFRDALDARLRCELVPGFIDGDPVLQGFRDLHDAVRRSNKRFPSSAEALVSLYQRKGLVPRINALVDIYNAVSLETRLSLGAHDVAKLDGDVTLKLADGSERFVPLGTSDPEPIHPGEYVYADDSNEVICRLEHRQCEKTKVTAATTACFYIIQGSRATSDQVVRAALARLEDLTRRFCGGGQGEVWIA